MPAEFVDREAELATIERMLDSRRAELVIVYGPRGVGKSELLVRGLTGRPGRYYQATAEVITQQLADLAAEMRRTATGALIGQFAASAAFLDALTSLAQAAPDRPFPVVIDTFRLSTSVASLRAS